MNEEYDDWTAQDFRDELAERGLETKGNKPVLRKRLEDDDRARAEAGEAEEDDAEPDDEDEPDDDSAAPDEDDEPADEAPGVFRFTLTLGNGAFLGDRQWQAENRELARKRAVQAGHTPRGKAEMAGTEDGPNGLLVHYDVPV